MREGFKASPCSPKDKFALWDAGKAVLRGANVFMGRNPEGGPGGFGDGPFSQSDFNDLALAGANYVQISHAGLFSETPPYELDPAAQKNLDSVIKKVEKAGLYAVLAFRSGPGRNENTITDRDGELLESIWTNEREQRAWAEMVAYAAQRYKDNPTIVGIDPMVEPNDYARHGYLEPEVFYARFGGTVEDFNGLAQRVTTAVREVDQTTPLLLEPDGFGRPSWLPYLKVTGDPLTVYTVHDYAPFEYTHQENPLATYPGYFAADDSDEPHVIDKAYLSKGLEPVREFAKRHHVPVAVTEWGAHRIAVNAGGYTLDRIALHDEIGNWAVWTWQPAGFDDPFSTHDPSPSNLALRNGWLANCSRPRS